MQMKGVIVWRRFRNKHWFIVSSDVRLVAANDNKIGARDEDVPAGLLTVF